MQETYCFLKDFFQKNVVFIRKNKPKPYKTSKQ